ncbi:Rid family hydrolase [Coraliomargarita sp. W4R53]
MNTYTPKPVLMKARIEAIDDLFEVRYARFTPPGGLEEYYITLQPNTSGGLFDKQLTAIDRNYAHALHVLGLDPGTAIMRRFYCSDPANQSEILKAHPLGDSEAPCVISIVGQAPLCSGKIALCAYHLNTPEAVLVTKRTGNTVEYTRGALSHYWTTHLTDSSAHDSKQQTRHIFEDYNLFLKGHQMRLAENVVRTWLYVRDVDSNYQGLVDARSKHFTEHGLTPDSHYIASTGIEGRASEAPIKVSMDAYAIAGLRAEQVKYLQAPSQIGPTYLYGVSFERATAIAFKDRQHIYISGTASIDPQGNVLHVGDVLAQLDRALLNIEALLHDANATLESVAHFIVYLRDPDDASEVRRVLDKRYPHTPTILTWASVCRPTWLVEIEAVAMTDYTGESLPMF